MKKQHKGGLKKGACTEEQDTETVNAWIAVKEGTIAGKASGLQANADEIASKALDAEKAVNEARILANAPEVIVEEPAIESADATGEEE